MLVVGLIYFIDLDSVMLIKSNSIWSWLIKNSKLSNCLEREPTFRWNIDRALLSMSLAIWLMK